MADLLLSPLRRPPLAMSPDARCDAAWSARPVPVPVDTSAEPDVNDERSIFDPKWQRWSHRNANFRTDETLSFLYKPHAFLVMAGVLSALLLEAFTTEHDTEANLKRGLKWVCGMALLVMTLNFNDGPFFRPHPAVWRLVLAATVLYELFLVLLLFQAPRDGRWLFSFYDPVLGPPLVAETYAETCDLYLPDAPEGPFAHLSHAIFDIFVIGHLFGWWVKSMIFRSYWVCWVMSVNFELLEMSLAFQLPNFNECWWDSWLLDVLICNGLGIYLGMKTGEWLEMRKYRFENVWQIPTLTGKMKRAANQLMPMSWTHFEWRPSQSLNSWLGVLSIMLFSVAVELNAFYLKHVLYIPSYSNLNLYRLCIISPACAVATREIYQYFSDKDCKRFGQQAWMVVVIILTEIVVVIKYGMCMGEECVPMPVAMKPQHILMWVVIFVLYLVGTVFRFGHELKGAVVNGVHVMFGSIFGRPPTGALSMGATTASKTE